MREIIFRGKRADNGEWVEGYYNGMAFEYGFIAVQEGNLARWNTHPVLPDTVGQFTGLTDKNGKLIFEGDIVRLCESVKLTFGVESGEVRYYRGGFVAGKGNGFNNSLDALADADWKALRGEIIGNIYDNPELLEGLT